MKVLALLITTVIVGAVATAMWSMDDREFTAPPLRHSQETSLQPSVSTLVVPLSIRLRDIERLVNRKLPSTLYEFDRLARRVMCFDPIPDPAIDALERNCVDLKVKGWVKRNGPVEVVPAGEELVVRVPVRGRVRARGAGGPLSLVKKTGHGEFTVSFYLEPGVSEEGELDLAVSSDFDWDVPLHTKVLGQKIDLSKVVDKVLRKGLRKVEGKIREVAQDHMRWGSKVERAYRRLQQPIQVNDDPEIWMLMQARNLLVSDLLAVDNDVTLPLGVHAEFLTVVGAQPEYSVNKVFPPLLRVGEIRPDFSLNLPLVLTYDYLRSELARGLVGMQVPVADWLPGASIVIRRARLYPSGSKLAVGVDFETRGLFDWLSADGSIFLTGTPVFDNETKHLSVPDLEFTRRTGNSLLDFGSYLFADELRTLLRKTVRFDVSGAYKEIIDQANQAFNRNYGKDISLRGKLERLSISDIEIRHDDMIVYVHARGRLEALTFGEAGS